MALPLRCEDVYTAAGGPFTFTAAPGACLTIMGPSGVGKSLLLRALADLDPHRGDVFLGETRQADCPPQTWRRQVSYVPAAAGWWAETVAEHFGDFRALHADLLALGLAPECGAWPVSRLSSGEKQRLALLRSVALAAPG
jgi:putative ABC transport system ATP-binding protein